MNQTNNLLATGGADGNINVFMPYSWNLVYLWIYLFINKIFLFTLKQMKQL